MNNMPPVVKNLLIINLLCFVACLINPSITETLGLHFMGSSHFHFFQFFTYMFMHAGFEHIFFNMFAVWMFGRIMEHQMGSKRFLIYYMACGLGAGVIQEIVQFIHYFNAGGTMDALSVYDSLGLFRGWYTVGASGAVYGILLAFGMTFPDERMFVFPIPVPIKAKYFVMGYALLEVLSAMGRPGDGVAHFAHLGGMLFGFALLKYWQTNTSAQSVYGSYDRNGSSRKSGGIGKWFSNWKKKSKKQPDIKVTTGGKYDQDMEYRRRKKEEEQELNEILDKVRKSGYTNLTEEEKKRLFDISKRK